MAADAGHFAAAWVGIYFSYRVRSVARLGDAAQLLAFKNTAWRSIFWVSLPPGMLFVLGSLLVGESPRWLFRAGRRTAALRLAASFARANRQNRNSRDGRNQRDGARRAAATGKKVKESLLRRKYVIPFLLACIILVCNTATGINSIIGFNTSILLQSGLSDLASALGLRDLHHGEFPDDHGGHDAGGPEGAQVPALSGQRRELSFRWSASVCSFSQTEKLQRG